MTGNTGLQGTTSEHRHLLAPVSSSVQILSEDGWFDRFLTLQEAQGQQETPASKAPQVSTDTAPVAKRGDIW